MQRLPLGYRGVAHETIGSDILAVLGLVPYPERVFDLELRVRLKEVRPDRWSPIALLLDVLDVLDTKIGKPALREMGRQIFRDSHQERTKGQITSAADILFGIDQLYHHVNRGTDIGGWYVESFKPNEAVISKNTPHHCWLEHGILTEGMGSIGIPTVISQTECFRTGGALCRFVVKSPVDSAAWGKARPQRPPQR